jgi:hypothetical protein
VTDRRDVYGWIPVWRTVNLLDSKLDVNMNYFGSHFHMEAFD